MNTVYRYMALCALLLGMAACSPSQQPTFDMATLQKDLMEISSDSMMGRAPCSRAEPRTIDYLERRMKQMGLVPAFEDGYLQPVRLVKMYSTPTAPVEVVGDKGKSLSLRSGDDICVWSPNMKDQETLKESPLVFVGFGITAPESNWDDFAGLDLTGKTIVVLVNDPGYYTKDSTLFKGSTMTYYGRWRYKFEEAERRGAAGCLIVHEEGAAGYPWAVTSRHSTDPEFYLKREAEKEHRCGVQGWLSKEAAERMLALSGLSYEELKQQALKPGFKPVEMNTKLSVTLTNKWDECVSYNVGGYVKGSERPDECVVYTAHWDHLGMGIPVNGDSIYNGASDNAAAVSWALSIAKAFAETPKAPKRSVLFLIPTAEEPGLLGSEFYVKHPAPRLPIDKTVACINSDVILFLGRFKDVTITGMGHSELDDYVRDAAAKQDRYVCADPNPENGMFFRSDQLPFLKAGVPCIFGKGYAEQRELGKEKTQEKINEYWRTKYHKPQDEYNPAVDNLDGLLEDVQLFYEIGRRLANEDTYPKFNKSSEFYKERIR